MPTSQRQAFTEYGDAIYDFAAKSYRRCCEWFGIPPESFRKYTLKRSNNSLSRYNSLSRKYTIVLKDTESYEDCCFILAQEIYFCVTFANKSNKEYTWVDLTWNMLTALALLRENGMEEFADDYEYNLSQSIEHLDMAKLRHFNPQIARFGILLYIIIRRVYNSDYQAGIVCLATALRRYLDWTTLCSLTRYSRFSEWRDSLSAPQQYFIGRVIKEEALVAGSRSTIGAGRLTPEATFALRKQTGMALYDVKDILGAAEELTQANALQEDAEVLHTLGKAMRHLERFEESLDSLRRAVMMEPSDFAVNYSLAYTFFTMKRYEDAAEAFRRVLNITPDAWAKYHLGLALNEMGRRSEARKEWLELVNERYEVTLEAATELLKKFP